MDLSKQRTGWANLSLELRRAIWGLVYATQDARVVEVRTAKHDHHEQDHRWCPRFSPSPRPVMVNVCHDARSIGQDLARRAGHLIFPGAQDTSDIYFNYDIDTLFVRNEKDYWIRDWGPEGILTQFWETHSPASLRFLAIELDPLSRATTRYSLELDLFHFSQLEELAFIVESGSKEAEEQLRVLNRHRAFLVRHGGLGVYPRPNPEPEVSPRLKVFRLARHSRGVFDYLC